jgi:hypothetical protein
MRLICNNRVGFLIVKTLHQDSGETYINSGYLPSHNPLLPCRRQDSIQSPLYDSKRLNQLTQLTPTVKSMASAREKSTTVFHIKKNIYIYIRS